ncbi:hypothetical protein ACIA8G_05145 [Lentzea sp. NPDC051213]|uniref:hypothetical protein n=1 Tax=Lentzea sp. NPDC051213 TaxID=3364126 RepID=UPI003795EB9C
MKMSGVLGKTAAAIAVAMALTGCTTEPSNRVDPLPNPDEMAVKWAQCMRENGANVPDPDPNVGGRGEPAQRPLQEDPEKVAKAAEHCKQYAGSGPAKTTDPAEADRQAKYDQCLRDRGIVVRQDPEGARVVEETDKAKLEKAVRECGGAK